jgi:hypothetical protein
MKAFLFRAAPYFEPVSRSKKIILVALALVVGVFIAATVGANLFLKTEGVQARLRQGTEASLGVPIEIGGISFSIFGGITLHDIRTSEANEVATGQSFEAERLRIQFAWFPLLQGQLVITSIALESPVMIVPENRPVILLPPEGRVEVSLPEDANESPLPADTSEVPPETAGTDLPAEKSRPGFVVEIQRFDVKNGEVQVRTARGAKRLLLTGLNIETRIQSMERVSGHFRLATAEMPGQFVLRNISAPFQRHNQVVEVDEIQADWAGGRLVGEANIAEATGDFDLELTISAVQIPQLLKEAGFGSGRTSGFVEGAFELSGGRNSEDLRGNGEFFLREATLEPLDFMKQVGQLLQIEELQLLALRDALLRISLADSEVKVSELRMVTENLIILSEGRVMVGAGQLDLQSRLLVSDTLQRSLGGLITGFLQESDTEGYREVPFRIHGPLLRPRTDLLDRIGVGRVGGEVGRFIQNLFGAPQPSDQKKDE